MWKDEWKKAQDAYKGLGIDHMEKNARIVFEASRGGRPVADIVADFASGLQVAKRTQQQVVDQKAAAARTVPNTVSGSTVRPAPQSVQKFKGGSLEAAALYQKMQKELGTGSR